MNDKDAKIKENLTLFKLYKELINYARVKNIPLSLSLETFEEEYEMGTYESPELYLEAYYNILKVNENNKELEPNLNKKWYYNTGIFLAKKPTYDKYHLLSNVQSGDIIFENKGGFGLNSHIGIVEGIFYNETFDCKYVRVIETTNDGVVRSVLDDERIDDHSTVVLRAKNESIVASAATDFCIAQLGKSFCLDFKKNISKKEEDWYCSELVWAAYKSLGIDIESIELPNEPGITPNEIRNSDELIEVEIKKMISKKNKKQPSKAKIEIENNTDTEDLLEENEEKKAFIVFALSIIVLVILAALEPYFKKKK